MTRTEISRAIKSANTNPDIKWHIASAKKNSIEIGNDYLSPNETFTIQYGRDDWLDPTGEIFNTDCITVIDACTNERIFHLFKDDFFYDFKDADDGLRKGIIKAVEYFNYHY